MTRCVFGRVPAPAPLSFGAIPYMRADLREKRHALARAGLAFDDRVDCFKMARIRRQADAHVSIR